MRAQRARQVQSLREKGLTRPQIAAKLGISVSYVQDLIYDPDGTKARARKDSYRGTCKICGAGTNGSDGPNKAPEYCSKHANRVYNLIWSKSKIIACIHEWYHIYGVTPVAPDWLRKVEGSPGQYVGGSRSKWAGKRRWPTVNAVQLRFGSWANAIEAAGFPRPKIGHYRDESKRGEILTKWTPEAIIEWMKNNADEDRPPSSLVPGAPIGAAVRKFGSWRNAQAAAGFEPNAVGGWHRVRLARSTH